MEITKEMQEIIDSIPNRQLLRIDEVASFFQITKTTVYNWYEDDKIKGTKINGILRIYRQSIIDMIISGNGKKGKEESEKAIEIKIKRVSRPNRKGWVKNW